MEKLFVLLVIALVADSAFGMAYRQKRQTDDDEDAVLEERYNVPGRPPFRRPNQFPGQNQFPWQNQFPGQTQFPGQNQIPGQNIIPGQNQFPGQTQFPGQNQIPGQQPVTQAPIGSTTQSDAVRTCLTSCPVTSEYNPVCGSDNVVYPNPGRLSCAQSCGVNVRLLRVAPCPPATTPAPSK